MPRSDVERPLLVGGAQDDRRPGGDVRLGPDPGQQRLELGRGPDPHLEDVALLARDRVAGLDLGQRAQPLGRVVRGAGVDRPDRDERRQRQPHGLRVDHRGVPADHTPLLQPADPLVHGRGGQPGGPAQVGVAHPAVAAQQADDLAVDVLHAGHRTAWPRSRGEGPRPPQQRRGGRRRGDRGGA